jgi:hypothetical protein
LKRKAEIDARMKQREEELKKKHNEGTGSNSSGSDPQQIAKNFDTQFTTMKKGTIWHNCFADTNIIVLIA